MLLCCCNDNDDVVERKNQPKKENKNIKKCEVCGVVYDNFYDIHCCSCKTNYVRNFIAIMDHCCDCKMAYWRGAKHCCNCKLSYVPEDEEHCCICKKVYNTDNTHQCNNMENIIKDMIFDNKNECSICDNKNTRILHCCNDSKFICTDCARYIKNSTCFFCKKKVDF